jgi:hypothetical protein
MDRLDEFRDTIERVMTEYARIPYRFGEVDTQTVFDRKSDHYLLMLVGWEKGKRVHGCLTHMDIIDGKIWVQRDGTEDGMALDLVRAGIPKQSIVLGFQPAHRRPYTEFAVA